MTPKTFLDFNPGELVYINMNSPSSLDNLHPIILHHLRRHPSRLHRQSEPKPRHLLPLCEQTGGAEEAEANAALIAAAPDLYAALTKINEWACFASEEDVSARLMALQQIGLHARAAIAKAEGRS